jgi:hypothetical protein
MPLMPLLPQIIVADLSSNVKNLTVQPWGERIFNEDIGICGTTHARQSALEGGPNDGGS